MNPRLIISLLLFTELSGTASLHNYTTVSRIQADQIISKDSTGPRPPLSKAFSNGALLSSFSAKDLEGNRYKLKDLKGKVVVLNFWFIKCGPCRKEIPDLNRLADTYKDSSDIVFLAIALDGASDLERFLKENPFKYHIINDGRFITEQYNIQFYPTHVILDKEGKVFFHTQGLASTTVPWLNKSIKSLLGP